MSWLWLGTWSLGGEGFGPSDERESRKVLELALEAGIRHFDTAGFYAHGRSERLLARALGMNRRQCFISTKGGLVWDGRKVLHQASPEALRQALMESLERLRTDYLDLFQLHWPDPQVPIEESLAALREFQAEGLIRFWGVGNFDAAQVGCYLLPGERIPHQVHFNPIHRSDDILTAGRQDDRCLNCVISPLEQGLLGASRGAGGLQALGNADVRRRNPHFSCAEAERWVARFRDLADRTSLPRAAIVLLWILAHEEVDVIIPGPRTVAQLAEILGIQELIARLGLDFQVNDRYLRWKSPVEEVFEGDLWEWLESFQD